MVKYSTVITPRDADFMIDYSMHRKKMRKSLRNRRILMGILGLFSLGLAYLSFSSGNYILLAADLIVAAVTFFVAFDASCSAFRFMLKKKQHKMNAVMYSGEREYEFSDDGITIASELGKGFHNWKSFVFYEEYKNHLMIADINDMVVMVDKDRIPRDDYARITGIVSRHIKRGED